MLDITLLFVFLSLNSAFSERLLRTQFPLSTNSRWIVDNSTKRVKLVCANWYGFEEKDYVAGGLQWQTISEIVSQIVKIGLNCMRIPFSLELIKSNPVIEQSKVQANPNLYNKRGLECLDAVIKELQDNNIMIILDNHMSDANWCCSGSDGNGLWYTDNYPEEDWIKYWLQLVNRYPWDKYPYIIGTDLRNELRAAKVHGIYRDATWYIGVNLTDWRTAAVKLANQILAINPNLLMIIEGIDYALDLRGAKHFPITNDDLIVPNKVVMSAHSYSWEAIGGINSGYVELSTQLDLFWGFLLEENKTYTAPVWVGETGICHYSSNSCLNSNWWNNLLKYLKVNELPFAIWALDGTESTGDGRTYGSEETFGLLNTAWNGYASEQYVEDVQNLEK